MLRMGNKVWIVVLGFCTFVFAALGLTLTIWMLIDHEPIWRVLFGALYFGLFAWKCLDATRSRIKYGPKGPPRDTLEDFHVDF